MGQQEKQKKFLKNLKLEAKPHIAMWKSGPPPDRNKPDCTWYMALNWQEKNNGQTIDCCLSLTNHFVYDKAKPVAIALGISYNLPVIEHDVVGFTVLWVPTKKSSAKKKKSVAELQTSKKAIRFTSAF